jgi:hypothetical protein
MNDREVDFKVVVLCAGRRGVLGACGSDRAAVSISGGLALP